MNHAILTVDVHGMRTVSAHTAVLAALRRSEGAYRVRVVHGYHAGTALRDMARTAFLDDPRVIRVVAVDAGVTDLVLREL